jgi:Spy/CpxP family protein refolding chaperone
MRLHPTRRLALLCCLMSLTLLAGSAIAQQQQRAGRGSTPGGFAEGRLMKKKAKEIGLSEETVTKITAAIEAGRAEEEKLREESKGRIVALDELLKKSRPSEKELIAAANKVGAMAEKSRALKMKSVVEVRALLSDEELAKFMEIRNKATARR